MSNLQNSNKTKSKEYINKILNQNYIRHWIVVFRIIGTDYTCVSSCKTLLELEFRNVKDKSYSLIGSASH